MEEYRKDDHSEHAEHWEDRSPSKVTRWLVILSVVLLAGALFGVVNMLRATLKAKPEYVLTTSEFNDVKDRLYAMHNRHKTDTRDEPTTAPPYARLRYWADQC